MAFPFIPLWLIFTAIIVAIVFMAVRASNSINVLSYIKDNFFYFFLLLFLGLFFYSMIKITISHDFDLTTMDGVGNAIKVYLNWFANFFKNVGRVTGYAIKQDWTSVGNSTVTK